MEAIDDAEFTVYRVTVLDLSISWIPQCEASPWGQVKGTAGVLGLNVRSGRE